MREVPCGIKIDRNRFNGSIAVNIQGITIKKRGLFRSKIKYFIPYSSIISVNLSKQFFSFKIKIVFQQGISVGEIQIEGDKRLVEVYESINKMRLNSVF